MKRLNFLVSLTNNDNDYQQEQWAVAEKAAHRLGVDLQIVHANNDPLTQSQQLLHYIQDSTVRRPDAIIFEPAGGTAFPQVARAATAAGMGWVVLNYVAEYAGELRSRFKVPVFSISSDHEQVGRIQGKQLAAMLPEGGTVLHIEGPANSAAAKDRTRGMMQTKPANVQIKSIRGNWTEESGYKALSSWLRLRTSLEGHFDLVASQNDSMAMGARKAFSEIQGVQREKWTRVPLIGCDGMPKTGQAWVRQGMLTATIFIPPNADLAVEMLTETMRHGAQHPESKMTEPESIPKMEQLAALGKKALEKSAGA